MEEKSTQVSPSTIVFNNIIELDEDYDTPGETNIIESRCDICGKILSCKKNMKKHLKLHSDQRNYICEICHKSYKRSDHLKRHMISHDPEPNYFECDYCLKRFNLKYHLTTHLQNVHGKSTLKIYKCPDCDECFYKKSKLFLHQKNVHNLVVDKIPCYYPYCNKSYISLQKLNHHIQTYHLNLINNSKDGLFSNQKNNNENIFNFNSKGDINEDMDSENSNKEKKFFKCPYKECFKVYSSHYNLSVHIKTFHLKIKSFHCSLCGNNYYHKVSLKNHLIIEHKFTQDKLTEFLKNLTKENLGNKKEIIEQAKINFENEGLYKENNEKEEKEKWSSSINNSRKNSEDGSHETKSNEFILKEFHENIINDINYSFKEIES